MYENRKCPVVVRVRLTRKYFENANTVNVRKNRIPISNFHVPKTAMLKLQLKCREIIYNVSVEECSLHVNLNTRRTRRV